MRNRDPELDACIDVLDVLLTAVTTVQEWRERCLLGYGGKPPTSYYRVLLWLYVNHVATGGKPQEVPHMGREIGISVKALTSILRQMTYDGLVTVRSTGKYTHCKEVNITPTGIQMAQV